ncbi:hypothetical protein Tco_1005403 [Tanacetum coccineum]|uniref:Retrovirus-related Pol polyprotein from transposon TNT 1-94-like beta-barrel domain-containing protein n=1 Tax=Tanacetum coccineum TaxID=301880 RepID=A0ABQ5FES1_9ASTR
MFFELFGIRFPNRELVDPNQTDTGTEKSQTQEPEPEPEPSGLDEVKRFSVPIQVVFTLIYAGWTEISRFFVYGKARLKAILAQMYLDDALLGHDKMPLSWINDENKQNDHTILYSRDTLTLEEFYEALHAKEKMKHMVSYEGSSSQAEGVIVYSRQNDKNTNSNQKGRNSGNNMSKSKSGNWKPNNNYCKYYKYEDHDIYEYFKLKNKEKKYGTFKLKTNLNDKGKATFVASENFEGEVLVAYVGCGSVLMGDNPPYIIEGIASIQVKMFDGAIRAMEDARHVPGINRNLISLSTLNLKGCKDLGEAGVLNVLTGSLIVMKVDIKSANLYHIRGTTITCN